MSEAKMEDLVKLEKVVKNTRDLLDLVQVRGHDAFVLVESLTWLSNLADVTNATMKRLEEEEKRSGATNA